MILKMKKKSFILYIDQLDVVKCMDDAEAGKFLKAIYAHQTGNLAELESILKENHGLEMAFSFLRNSLEANEKKYEEVCKRKQEAGRKGGKQRVENLKNSGKPEAKKQAKSSKSKQSQANEADTVTDTGIDTVTENVSTTVDINKERYSDEYPKKAELSLPPSSDSSTKTEFECLNEWMPQNTPFVLKLAMQMTEDEYLRLRRTYSKTQIADGLQALNNWKQLPKRRTSVYQSLSDELTRRYGQQK